MSQSSDMLASVLQDLGFDPRASLVPGPNGPAWLVQDSSVALFLVVENRDGISVLRLDSPLVYMPAQDLLPFYRKLLGLNLSLTGTALAMQRDVVHLVGEQALDGLIPAAASGLIKRTMRTAEALSGLLVQEFPTARSWSPL